jgi:hypothetical protein
MAKGAVARRNRTLRIYGAVLLVGIVALIVYCSRGRSFDLSTPKSALETFQWTMDDHRWSEAEKCMSDECRKYYAEYIADRRIFDLYKPPQGYVVGGDHRFRANWEIGEITVKGDTARAKIKAKAFIMGAGQAYVTLDLRKCADGLWRIDGPRVNFMNYYDHYIDDKDKGWAKTAERK